MIILGYIPPVLHKNICYGYLLEVPCRDASDEYHNICFYGEIRKIIPELLPNSPQVLHKSLSGMDVKAQRGRIGGWGGVGGGREVVLEFETEERYQDKYITRTDVSVGVNHNLYL